MTLPSHACAHPDRPAFQPDLGSHHARASCRAPLQPHEIEPALGEKFGPPPAGWPDTDRKRTRPAADGDRETSPAVSTLLNAGTALSSTERGGELVQHSFGTTWHEVPHSSSQCWRCPGPHAAGFFGEIAAPRPFSSLSQCFRRDRAGDAPSWFSIVGTRPSGSLLEIGHAAPYPAPKFASTDPRITADPGGSLYSAAVRAAASTTTFRLPSSDRNARPPSGRRRG